MACDVTFVTSVLRFRFGV